MLTDISAERLLCFQAGSFKDSGPPPTVMQTGIATYFASVQATEAAQEAIHIHEANGGRREYLAQRYLRNTKIMEIIEGNTQIQQMTIARVLSAHT